jgi:hypothetical protein
LARSPCQPFDLLHPKLQFQHCSNRKRRDQSSLQDDQVLQQEHLHRVQANQFALSIARHQ